MRSWRDLRRIASGNAAVDRCRRVTPAIDVRLLSSSDVERQIDALAALLLEAVNGGEWLAMVPPLTGQRARDYWLALRPELDSGARVLLAGYRSGRMVGSGQLSLPGARHARHRAFVEKLIVAGSYRGQGIGRQLMAALSRAAVDSGRSLIVLYTRAAAPSVHFYRSLGYRTAGVVPGYSQAATGEAHDIMTLYRQFGSGRAN